MKVRMTLVMNHLAPASTASKAEQRIYQWLVFCSIAVAVLDPGYERDKAM